MQGDVPVNGEVSKQQKLKLFQILMTIEKKVEKGELLNTRTGRQLTKQETNEYAKKYIEKVIAGEI